jgi:hypothetical protein
MLILGVIFVIFIGMVIGGGVDRGAYRVSYQLSVIGRSSVTLIFLSLMSYSVPYSKSKRMCARLVKLSCQLGLCTQLEVIQDLIGVHDH